MTLKINSSYQTAAGYLIPRSHFEENSGEKYCIVQILTLRGKAYASRHVTMNVKELRAALELGKKERIEII